MGLILKKMKTTEIVRLGYYFTKWLWYSSLVGIGVGSLSAFFLISLTFVTNARMTLPWLLYLLPLGGAAISWLYWKLGGNAIRGNNLIIQEAHGTKKEVESIPKRLIPLTLFGTLVTHLFGGSAGREGTAVQIGGTLADAVGRVFHMAKNERRILLIAGMSAGFSSVFGTPIAGTLFAMEVLAIGFVRQEALFPSLWAALVGNWVTTFLGASHAHYSMGIIPEATIGLIIKIVIAAILFGFTGRLFSWATRLTKIIMSNWFNNPVIKSFIGGIIVILLVFLVGTREYLGLSLPLIDQAFLGESGPFDSLGKLVFTAVTLGSGFQGGEVTPLFTIGATLGSTLAHLFHISIPFLAGLGFIGVFAAASNTPIACFIMGLELFGSGALPYLFLTCVISYLFSGNQGIYETQQVYLRKGNLFEEE
ncbi:MAG: voltage-gated chloride channel family protein [Carnobacterium sp.]|uniref:voltage-gated chloride channel family protein n=1 Tax=Carnobacterium sp. TaxID=48221 RepID=UPI003315E248